MEKSIDMKYDVFLSYNRNDNDRYHVKDLSQDLSAYGYEVFLDEENPTELVGDTLGNVLEKAISRSRIVVVCIGMMGLGPTQKKEVEFARKLNEAAVERGHEEPSLPVIIPSTLGFTIREDLSDSGIPGWLKANIVHSYPKYEKRHDGIIDKIKVVLPKSDDQKYPDVTNDDIPGVIREFSDYIVEDGLTVFLGTCWPESAEDGYYNPYELRNKIVDLVNVDNTENISLEQAVAAAVMATSNQRDLLQSFKKEKKNVDKMYSLFAPRVVTELARTLEHLQRNPTKRGGDPSQENEELRPLTVFSTSPDILLERELAWHGVSFLRVIVTPGVSYRLSMVFVEDARSELRVRQLIDGLPTKVKSVLENDFNATTTEYEIKDYEIRRINDGKDRQSRIFNGAISNFPGVNKKQLWQLFEVSRILKETSKSSGLDVSFEQIGKNDGDIDASTVIVDWCEESSIPIVVKLYGCVNDDRDIVGFSMEQIAKATRSGNWIPRCILEKILKTPTVFAGFKSIGLDFQSLLFGHLRQQEGIAWSGNADRYFIPVEKRYSEEERYMNFDQALYERRREFSSLEIEVFKYTDAWEFFNGLNRYPIRP